MRPWLLRVVGRRAPYSLRSAAAAAVRFRTIKYAIFRIIVVYLTEETHAESCRAYAGGGFRRFRPCHDASVAGTPRTAGVFAGGGVRNRQCRTYGARCALPYRRGRPARAVPPAERGDRSGERRFRCNVLRRAADAVSRRGQHDAPFHPAFLPFHARQLPLPPVGARPRRHRTVLPAPVGAGRGRGGEPAARTGRFFARGVLYGPIPIL